MRRLTIEAASALSARDFYDALSAFKREIEKSKDGRWRVSVSLDPTDGAIVSLLNALQHHVSERATGPARLEMDGNSYLLESHAPEPASQELR
jgi:hypothetical protein